MNRFRECILTCVNTSTRGGSALHEGELCTRDHLSIPGFNDPQLYVKAPRRPRILGGRDNGFENSLRYSLEGDHPAAGTEVLEKIKTWFRRHQIVQSHHAIA